MTFLLKCSKPSCHKGIDECNTLGEHLRRRRLHLNEHQSCVAQKLGVFVDTVSKWENNTKTPKAKHVPLILKYLGYTPLFEFVGTSLSKKLEQFMYVNGLTQKECAKKLGIDRSTLVRYLNNKITDERAIQTLRLSTSTYCALD